MSKEKKNSTKIYDLLAKVDSTATQNGEKAKWQKLGVMLQKETGFSIKLDCIPISQNWDGWVIVKDRTEKEEPF